MIKLEQYIDPIIALPEKDDYLPDEVLTTDFLLEQEGPLSIYYCAHTEYINPSAKVVIVGITPGFSQLQHSLAIAKQQLAIGTPVKDIPYLCKKECRLYGSMRTNTIDMLDQLGLQHHLGIASCVELFEQRDDLLHNTSIIPYAVFNKGKNYTGQSPKILKSPLLSKYVEQYFTPELKQFSNSLIIPLGKSVEEVILHQCSSQSNQVQHCLSGFPHPSGANGHRKKQFDTNKEQMKELIERFFNE